MAEELDAILIQVCIPLPIPMIYTGFTDAAHVQGWLSDHATIEAKKGGAYDLAWNEPKGWRSEGEVLQMTPDVDLDVSWEGPPELAPLMNEPLPKTHVYVRLQESPEGIDVTLEHAGWGSGDAWEAARSWHFHFWDDRLHRLKDYLIKTAYG